jgi:hypothetical protein
MNFISINSVAITFKVVSALIGLPSLAVLVLYAINEIRSRLSPVSHSLEVGKNPDAILLMLKLIADSVGLLGRLGEFLFHALAIIAVFGLMLSLALWFTSRGLQVHANWARISALVLLLLALLPSLVLALSLHNVVRVVPLLLALICLLGLRAVWLNQIPQTH